MLTTNRPRRLTAPKVRLVSFRHTSSMGGSVDRDATALTVAPNPSPATAVVMTHTPVGKCPMACRNSSAVTGGESGACSALTSGSFRFPKRLIRIVRARSRHVNVSIYVKRKADGQYRAEMG